jgi:prevent-host-death family protein
MRKITVAEAARSFMAILKAAEAGEEVIITRAGRPIAKLAGLSEGKTETPADPARPRLRSLGFRDHP